MSLPPYARKGKTSSGQGLFGIIASDGDATIGGFVNGSAAGPLTAHSGGTKAAALQLAASYNLIGTVAAANDSLLAPAAVAGRSFVVDNAGANIAKIYGKGTDTIDAVATATGNAITNAHHVLFVCYVAGAWISYQLGIPTA